MRKAILFAVAGVAAGYLIGSGGRSNTTPDFYLADNPREVREVEFTRTFGDGRVEVETYRVASVEVIGDDYTTTYGQSTNESVMVKLRGPGPTVRLLANPAPNREYP